MNPLLVLGLLGVGGYILFSSKSAAASPAGAPMTPQQQAALLAANPSGLAPGFQGQYTGPQPYLPPEPTPIITDPYAPLSTNPFDPSNPAATAAGWYGGYYDPLSARWYG
jgi:hypothetical protein